MKVLISNIQRFSLHDGPGIRTTVFFMGCPLNCPWCCNPENKTQEIKMYTDEYGTEQTYGKYYSIEELKFEILKDVKFYKNDGGVTYSGGEALLHLNQIVPLLRDLKELNINQCVETTLSVPSNYLKDVVDFIDLFYIDLKIINSDDFKSKLNGDFDSLYSNLKLLKKKNKKFIFRIPLVKGYTLSETNIKLIKNIINEFNPFDIEVFSVHNLAKQKYKNLNLLYTEFEVIDKEIVDGVQRYLKEIQ